jgi:hypothetical protein
MKLQSRDDPVRFLKMSDFSASKLTTFVPIGGKIKLRALLLDDVEGLSSAIYAGSKTRTGRQGQDGRENNEV